MFLLMLITAIGGILQCCCLCCCKKSILRKQSKRENPSQGKRAITSVFFGIILLLWLIGGAIIFSASPYFTEALSSFHSSTVLFVSDTKDLVDSIIPTVNTTIDDLNSVLNQDLQSVYDVIDLNYLNTNIIAGLQNILTDMQSIDSSITTVQGLASDINTARASLLSFVSGTLTTGNSKLFIPRY